MRAGHQQRVPALFGRQSGNDFDIGSVLGHHLVDTEKCRPGAGQAGNDRMIRLEDFRDDSLRRLDPVVVRQTLDGKRLLDRRAPPAGTAVDALEGQIAADHHQSTTLLRPVADELEAVRNGFAMQPHIGMQQQRIRADVRKDDSVITGQPVQGQRKFGRGLVGLHVSERELAVLKRGDKRLGAKMKGDAGKTVPAFGVAGSTHPAFADEKHVLLRHSHSSSYSFPTSHAA